MKMNVPQTGVWLGNILDLVITRMGADSSQEGVNRKGLELTPNKEKHVTVHKPKQTNQTDNSFQEKHTSWYWTKPSHEHILDTDVKIQKGTKWFLLLVKVVLCLIYFLTGWYVVNKLKHKQKMWKVNENFVPSVIYYFITGRFITSNLNMDAAYPRHSQRANREVPVIHPVHSGSQ